MRLDRTSRRALVVTGVAALVMLAASSGRLPLMLLNRTPSIPTGIYIYRGSHARRGDVVAFALPPAAWQYARRRGEPTDVLLLKHVLAASGDFVSTLDDQLRINGARIGSIASVDSAGRVLPHWSTARVLSGDELIVGSTHPRSFDSRYFGPIHADQVLGVYRRLTFHSPSALSTASGSQCVPLSINPAPLSAPSASGG